MSKTLKKAFIHLEHSKNFQLILVVVKCDKLTPLFWQWPLLTQRILFQGWTTYSDDTRTYLKC